MPVFAVDGVELEARIARRTGLVQVPAMMLVAE